MFRASILAAAFAALSFVTPAHALPLLAENAGLNVSEILTVYPDSTDANLVYFIPNTSRLARDASGLPQFGFTYWGLGGGKPLNEAGAYLTFSLRLDSDPGQKAALQSLLDKGKRVAVIPVQASTVGLSSTKEGPPLGRLFEEFNFAQKGGLMGDEVGVNAVLTGLGAKVFKAAIDTPQLVKAEYCYRVQGLGPNFQGTVHVEMDRVYDSLSASFGGGGFFFRKDISAAVERLKDQGYITIHSDGGDATDREYLQKVTDDIVAKLFQPELKTLAGDEGKSGWALARVSLRIVHKSELKSRDFSYTRRDLVEREFCSNLAVKDIQPYKAQLVRNADAE